MIFPLFTLHALGLLFSRPDIFPLFVNQISRFHQSRPLHKGCPPSFIKRLKPSALLKGISTHDLFLAFPLPHALPPLTTLLGRRFCSLLRCRTNTALKSACAVVSSPWNVCHSYLLSVLQLAGGSVLPPNRSTLVHVISLISFCGKSQRCPDVCDFE